MNNELAIKLLQYEIDRWTDESKRNDVLKENIKQLEQSIELLKNPKEFDEIDMMNAIEYGHDLAMQETTRRPEQWIEDYRKQKLTTESK